MLKTPRMIYVRQPGCCQHSMSRVERISFELQGRRLALEFLGDNDFSMDGTPLKINGLEHNSMEV